MRWWALFGVLLSLGACGSDPPPTPPPTSPGGGGSGGDGGNGGGADPCPSPNRLVDGDCLAPGQQDDGCMAGETMVDGTCATAGVAPAGCPEGFEPATDRCVPVIVEECPEGLMAPPGETTCRPPMSCGDGKWGDIPVDGDTIYVDQSYAGGDSDGSADKPFTTIGAGISAANEGALVAVAEGTYGGLLSITKSVRLWGLCPSKVRFESTGNVAAILWSAGTELHGITIADGAIYVANVEDILLEGLHIVGSSDIGVAIGTDVGASVSASVTVRSSLVERVERAGIIAYDSALVVEDSVIRGTLPHGSGLGAGIGVQQGIPNLPGSLTVRRTLVEGAHEAGIYATWSDVMLESVAVIGVEPNPNNDEGGFGVALQAKAGQTSAIVDGLYLRDTRSAGLYLYGSEADVERVTIEQVGPKASDALSGNGVLAGPAEEGANVFHSTLTLRWGVIDQTYESGVALIDAPAEIAGCVIQSTSPRPDGLFGHGVTAEGTNATIDVTGSVIDSHVALGLLVEEAEATLAGSVIRDVSSSADGLFGDGALVTGSEASLTVRASSISSNARAGLTAFGASLAIENTALGCNAIPLVAESQDDRAAALDDLGGNLCQCDDEAETCKAASASVSPPAALPEPPDPVTDG